jgi:hypothetical protein
MALVLEIIVKKTTVYYLKKVFYIKNMHCIVCGLYNILHYPILFITSP